MKKTKPKKNGNTKKPERHFNRLDSSIAALQPGPITRQQPIKQADKLYTKDGDPLTSMKVLGQSATPTQSSGLLTLLKIRMGDCSQEVNLIR